jgi:hypothetical protein
MKERARRETSSISRRALSAKVCGAADKDLEAFQVRELEIGRNISKLVAKHELNRLYRRETLHKKWDENVFIPTARKINKEMESKLAKFVRSKSVSYEAYLDHVNLRQRQHEKNTVFLNVHTPDYDALSCQRKALSARMRTTMNPTQVAAIRDLEDQKFMTPNPSKLRLKHPREPLLWNQVLLSDVCLPLRRPIPSHHAREHKPTESSSVKICSRRRSFPQKSNSSIELSFN